MTDLLTTKQVQALLRVDRTTIYRMVDGGQLPAIRVGKQWRFAANDVDRWLAAGRSTASGAVGGEPAVLPQSAALAPGAATGLGGMLPLACAQAAQDAFADLLGVTMVTTDMQGQPITEISNPCGFFDALLVGRPDGLRHCITTWQIMAGSVALDPRFTRSEMGLLCARGLIRVGSELRGMVVIGGIAPDNWPPTSEQAEELANLFGVPREQVVDRSDAVFRLDRPTQERALRFVQRVADVFSQMAQARLQTPAPGSSTLK